MSGMYPASDSEEDRAAAERLHGFANVWFLEPAQNGRYPDAYVGGSPLERWACSPATWRSSRRPWTSSASTFIPAAWLPTTRGTSPWAWAPAWFTCLTWNGQTRAWRYTRGHPPGHHANLERLPTAHLHHRERLLYSDGPDEKGVVNDDRRVSYYRDYIAQVGRAIQDGADVRGYYA